MTLPFRTRRSAGVPVTPAVHRVIARGNAARDRQDWAEGAARYRQALEMDPGLAHILVQLGNMEKEQGRLAEAKAAYERAVQARPGHADALLQLGHMAGDVGDHAKAGEFYLRAFTANPRLRDAASGLHRALAQARGRMRARLLAALRGIEAEDLPDAPATVPDGDGPALVFDVSDLVGYWVGRRLPTGIQRVQIQFVSEMLRRPGAAVGLCCFIDGRDDWLGIDAALFARTMALSVAGGDSDDPAWIAAMHRLHLHVALAPPFAFPRGATLVNLGASWQFANYFLFVRAAKERYGVRYVPLVHDLIPVVAPEYFTKPVRREMVSWVASMFAHADHVLTISEFTKRDLLRVGREVGRTFDPANVAVIPLNADFRAPDMPVLPAGTLAKWGLAGEPFVLLVSTVEARKGHAAAFDAWTALIARHGAAAVPRLVCVGRRGWLSGGVYRRLQDDPVLAARVLMLEAVSDAELALMYQACLFTLYPSLYEGWGLPITEALCYGKPVIASDTSSLPEAGGDHAVYVEAGSVPALTAAAERMVFDAPYRNEVAARIQASFRPQSWGDLAAQMQAELARLAARDSSSQPVLPRPVAQLGAFHSVARSAALRVWPAAGAGEAFRAGTGWTAPDMQGSWTRRAGAVLAVTLPPRTQPLRVGLLLLGAPGCGVDWRVDVRHGPALAGTLERGGRKWVTFTYPAADDGGVLRLRLRSESSDEHDDDDDEDILVGLAGFFVYADGDVAAGLRLLEAVALGNLDEVEAFREPVAPPAASDTEWA